MPSESMESAPNGCRLIGSNRELTTTARSGVYTSRMKPNPAEMVVLTAIPQGFLDDLPEEDQQAIREIVGKPVLLNEYDDAGRAELEFNDRDGQTHFIFVAADFIKAAYWEQPYR